MKLMFGLWLSHIVLAAWVVAPMAVIARRRAQWEAWESLAFVIPFWTWAALMLSRVGPTKTLANIGEFATISLAIVVATAIRVYAGRFTTRRSISAALLGSLVLLAVGTFFFTPPLPE